MLKAGSKAPEFMLENHEGAEVSLTDLLRDGPLILYFYPADFTPAARKKPVRFGTFMTTWSRLA